MADLTHIFFATPPSATVDNLSSIQKRERCEEIQAVVLLLTSTHFVLAETERPGRSGADIDERHSNCCDRTEIRYQAFAQRYSALVELSLPNGCPAVAVRLHGRRAQQHGVSS